MAEQFNAHLKWLGIPLKHQPPDHYRLLGLEPLESDPDVIENAADRQMAHVRTFRTGRRCELAEQLLAELAEARRCLLDADKKDHYDASLRAQQKADARRQVNKVAQPLTETTPPATGANGTESNETGANANAAPPSPAVPAPRAVAAPKPTAVVAAADAGQGAAARKGSAPIVVGGSTRSVSPRNRSKSPAMSGLIVLGALALGFMALAAVALPVLMSTNLATTQPADSGTSGRSSSSATRSTEDTSQAQDTVPRAGGSANGSQGALPSVPPAIPATNDTDTSDDSRPPLRPRIAEQATAHVPSLDLPGGDNGDDPLQDDLPTDGDTERPLKNTRPSGKYIAPDGGTRAKLEVRVRELFKISSRLSAQEQQELAQRLIAGGKDTSDNRDDQFVMLALGAELASGAGDLETALAAADFLDQQFEFDAVAMRLALVDEAAAATISPDQKQPIIESALPVLDEAVAAGRYAEVDKSITPLLAVVRRLKNRDLSMALIERRKSAAVLHALHDKAVAAHARLREDPDDPQANTTVGHFWCFVKGNWEEGLPLLAKGSNQALAALARLELQKPQDPVQRATLGADWLAAGKKESPPINQAMLRRASHWYELAQADATGLTRTAVDKGLAEVARLLAPNAPPEPTIRKATIVASCDSEFEMYLNGEFLARGSRGGGFGRFGRFGRPRDNADDRKEVETVERELNSGDVILVKGTNRRSEKGFACVIKFEGDDAPLATGRSPAWQLFQPANEDLWFAPNGVARVFPAQAADGQQHHRVREDSGVDCLSIWSLHPNRAYFVLRVP